MEDNFLTRGCILCLLLLGISLLTTCSVKTEDSARKWCILNVKKGVDVFYTNDDATTSSSCCVFIAKRDSECFNIRLSEDIEQYSQFLPVKYKSRLKAEKHLTKPTGEELLSLLRSCCQYSSAYYNFDSLSTITCSSLDFPELAIAITAKYKNDKDLDRLIKEVWSYSETKDDIEAILKEYNVTVIDIQKQPEGYCLYTSKRNLLDNYTIDNEMNIQDRILFVPLVLSIAPIKV